MSYQHTISDPGFLYHNSILIDGIVEDEFRGTVCVARFLFYLGDLPGSCGDCLIRQTDRFRRRNLTLLRLDPSRRPVYQRP